ncbi:MAG: IS110 family transposase [Chloroflexota bacterium]
MKRTLTRRIGEIEPYDLLVGIDLGKSVNVAVMVNQRQKQYGRFRFGHDRGEYERLKGWLRQNRAGMKKPQVLVGMEPTNDYWQWLASYLEQEGVPYRLVNPFTVKKTREGSRLDYAKDDNRDGETIAQLLGQGQFTETQLPAANYLELRHYEQARWQQSQALRRSKTILRQQVERLFPELRHIFSSFEGKTVRALLQNHADPHTIKRLSWDDFVAGVRQDFSGKRLTIKMLRTVYEQAGQSIGIQPGRALQQLIRQQLALLALQREQLEQLEAKLVACLHSLPIAPYLLSIGLGAVTSALIIAELGDLNRFTSAKQLVKLAGIQPTPNQSGHYQRHKTPMSRKGRVRLRTYLFFATLRLIRWDAAFAAQQRRLTQRAHKPLTKGEAVGALMNKLLHLLWALCRQQIPYSPDRFAPN